VTVKESVVIKIKSPDVRLAYGFPLNPDGEGTAHYFDWYSRELALIEADQDATLTLDETPFNTLRGWVEYTRQERGWAAEPNISSSITGQLKGAVARTEL